MYKSDETESGYIDNGTPDCYDGSALRDVEVIRETKTNVIARGRRYGRLWFLKGLREEFRDSAAMRRMLQKEFEIHSRLRHPAVPQVVGLEEVEGLGLCIVQEWIDGATLHDMLQNVKMRSTEKRRLMRDIVQTVAYLHSRGIVHRDLKPTNVMIRDVGKEVALIDYGLADTTDYVEMKGPAGTPGFISPEQQASGGANPADDVFSLGMMMRALSPGLRRLANRCTGPVKSRPKDAGALLKLMDSRARRPRVIMCVVAALLVAVIAVLGINRIRSLEDSSRVASERVGRLSDENARNAALVASLEDSLANVNGSLLHAKEELANVNGSLLHAKEELDRLTEYENLKQSAIREGCRMIDDILQNQDRIIDAKDPDKLLDEFMGIITKEMDTAYKTIKDYCSSLEKKGLTKEDLETIYSTLNIYHSKQQVEYQNKWIKKVTPVQ